MKFDDIKRAAQNNHQMRVIKNENIEKKNLYFKIGWCMVINLQLLKQYHNQQYLFAK